VLKNVLPDKDITTIIIKVVEKDSAAKLLNLALHIFFELQKWLKVSPK
jgi:hypothetical protein